MVAAIGAGVGLALSYAALRLLTAVVPLELRNVSLLDVMNQTFFEYFIISAE